MKDSAEMNRRREIGISLETMLNEYKTLLTSHQSCTVKVSWQTSGTQAFKFGVCLYPRITSIDAYGDSDSSQSYDWLYGTPGITHVDCMSTDLMTVAVGQTVAYSSLFMVPQVGSGIRSIDLDVIEVIIDI